MKKYLLLITLGCFAGATHLPAQVLTNFGSGTMMDPAINPIVNLPTPAGSVVAPWVGTQTATNFSVGTALLGVSDQVGGIQEAFGSPVPVTEPLANLTLTGSLQLDPSAAQNFTIILYDASFNDTRTYQFDWNDFSSAGNAYTGTFESSVGTFTGGVGGYELALGGSPTDTVSFTFDSLALTATSVPEPSTYAMFALGALLLYGVQRRKARA